eukprot:3474691-Prymnesium_polylepis.1
MLRACTSAGFGSDRAAKRRFRRTSRGQLPAVPSLTPSPQIQRPESAASPQATSRTTARRVHTTPSPRARAHRRHDR